MPGSWSQLGEAFLGTNDNDGVGRSVSLSSDGRIVAFGVPGSDVGYTNSGQARVYEWKEGSWQQRGQFIDGTGEYNDAGWSVSLTPDGNTLAVGARYNGDGYYNAGHVRVYGWDSISSTWQQRGMSINGEGTQDWSGWSVSMSMNGTVLAIGAPNNNGGTGHVRVHEFNGTQWVPKGQAIVGKYANEKSGESVSMSADGNILAIGAPSNSVNNANSGNVRVFQWNSLLVKWEQRGLDINGVDIEERVGISVSISSNGNTLAIGSPGSFSTSGHVSVYDWDSTSLKWERRGQSIDDNLAGNGAGRAVSLSADAQRVAIGMPSYNGYDVWTGGVKVYEWKSTVLGWVQIGHTIDGQYKFGSSGSYLALSPDGTRLVVGAPGWLGVGHVGKGHVKVYEYTPPPPPPTMSISIPSSAITLSRIGRGLPQGRYISSVTNVIEGSVTFSCQGYTNGEFTQAGVFTGTWTATNGEGSVTESRPFLVLASSWDV